MKRAMLTALLLAALLFLAAPGLAESRVIDEPGLLTAKQEASLEKAIEKIADNYQFDVVILFKNSLGGQSSRDYAADFYDYGGYGYGKTKDGILFLLSMAERDYYILTTGSGISTFTDFGISQIEEDVVPRLSRGDYDQAMERFLDLVDDYLKQAESGVPYDVDLSGVPFYGSLPTHSPAARVRRIFPGLLLAAAAVALGVTFAFKAQMKTVRRKPGAGSYVRDGSFALTRVQDIYLYTSTHRHRIETDSSGHGHGGHGGGSSTFSGHSGTSHGGHGGKF